MILYLLIGAVIFLWLVYLGSDVINNSLKNDSEDGMGKLFFMLFFTVIFWPIVILMVIACWILSCIEKDNEQ